MRASESRRIMARSLARRAGETPAADHRSLNALSSRDTAAESSSFGATSAGRRLAFMGRTLGKRLASEAVPNTRSPMKSRLRFHTAIPSPGSVYLGVTLRRSETFHFHPDYFL